MSFSISSPSSVCGIAARIALTSLVVISSSVSVSLKVTAKFVSDVGFDVISTNSKVRETTPTVTVSVSPPLGMLINSTRSVCGIEAGSIAKMSAPGEACYIDNQHGIVLVDRLTIEFPYR